MGASRRRVGRGSARPYERRAACNEPVWQEILPAEERPDAVAHAALHVVQQGPGLGQRGLRKPRTECERAGRREAVQLQHGRGLQETADGALGVRLHTKHDANVCQLHGTGRRHFDGPGCCLHDARQGLQHGAVHGILRAVSLLQERGAPGPGAHQLDRVPRLPLQLELRAAAG